MAKHLPNQRPAKKTRRRRMQKTITNQKSETHISKKTTYTDEEWQKQLYSAGEEVEDAAEVEYN